MDSIGKVFSHNLRKLRGDRKQEVVAAELDIPIATYGRMENGHIPNEDKIAKVANHYKVKETTLFLDPDLIGQVTPEQALEVLVRAIQKPDISKDPVLEEFVKLLPPLDDPKRAEAYAAAFAAVSEVLAKGSGGLGGKTGEVGSGK